MSAPVTPRAAATPTAAQPAVPARAPPPAPREPPILTPPSVVAYAWHKTPPRTAGTRVRTAAFAVDLVIIFMFAWAATFIAAATGLLRIPDITILNQESEVAGLLWIVSVFELPIALIYFTLAEALAGRTPGKLLFSLKVRRLDGHNPTLFDAFLRNLLRLLWVTPIGPVFVLVDLWSLRVTELDQRLGDLAAETVVVDESPSAFHAAS